MKSTSPLFNQGSGKLGNYVVSSRGDESIVSARVFDKPTSSEAQKSQQAVFGGNSSAYKHLLTPQQRAGWILLGSKMRSKTGKPLSGANAFSSVQNTLAVLGADPNYNAPLTVPYVASLPGVRVDAASTPSGAGFFLHLDAVTNANTQILVEVTPFLSAGLSRIPATFFRTLCVLPELNEGITNITTQYAQRMGRVPNSSQIAVRLTPLTADGFRGPTLTTAGFVALAPAEEAADAPEETAGEATGELHVSAPLSEDAQDAA